VRVVLASGETAEATAGSKRVAEQSAARALLERVERSEG
jgi:ribonuclease-3